MNWKKVRIGCLSILGLIIIIPSLLYVMAIDWSKEHRTRVDALPVFTKEIDSGEFRIKANNFEFLIRAAGMQNDGPAIILLHGFPLSSIMWQSMLDAAAAKGYRVIAFDQRGYSPNARPSGKEAYQIDHLVQDVLAVANQVEFDTFHLVGHDWGAGVSWKTTMDFPERVHTLTTLAIPHIGVFFDAFLNHPEQKKRSSYIGSLQLPILPELIFQINKKKFVEKVEGIWTPEQITEYKSMHSEHGAFTAALNWYRAADFEQISRDKSFKKKVTRPTLFIWGSKDRVVAPDIIPQQSSYIDAPFQILQLESGHSLIQEKQDSVLNAIFSHID